MQPLPFGTSFTDAHFSFVPLTLMYVPSGVLILEMSTEESSVLGNKRPCEVKLVTHLFRSSDTSLLVIQRPKQQYMTMSIPQTGLIYKSSQKRDAVSVLEHMVLVETVCRTRKA